MLHSRPVRCAVYTRKSSEEGLEQSFNSLHAQREACEAYINSQRHEGWTIVPTAEQAATILLTPSEFQLESASLDEQPRLLNRWRASERDRAPRRSG